MARPRNVNFSLLLDICGKYVSTRNVDYYIVYKKSDCCVVGSCKVLLCDVAVCFLGVFRWLLTEQSKKDMIF